MGTKYEVSFVRNGCCPYSFNWRTNCFIKALWWIFRLRVLKGYKIITLNIRLGYTMSDKCDADYCAKECEKREADTNQKEIS